MTALFSSFAALGPAEFTYVSYRMHALIGPSYRNRPPPNGISGHRLSIFSTPLTFLFQIEDSATIFRKRASERVSADGPKLTGQMSRASAPTAAPPVKLDRVDGATIIHLD